jgi:hypothetical protein
MPVPPLRVRTEIYRADAAGLCSLREAMSRKWPYIGVSRRLDHALATLSAGGPSTIWDDGTLSLVFGYIRHNLVGIDSDIHHDLVADLGELRGGRWHVVEPHPSLVHHLSPARRESATLKVLSFTPAAIPQPSATTVRQHLSTLHDALVNLQSPDVMVMWSR